jgi:hypothetical protein
MRSLPIVHARPFAQPRLALRAISDNYEHGSKYTDKGKIRMKNGVAFFWGYILDEKLCRIF